MRAFIDVVYRQPMQSGRVNNFLFTRLQRKCKGQRRNTKCSLSWTQGSKCNRLICLEWCHDKNRSHFLKRNNFTTWAKVSNIARKRHLIDNEIYFLLSAKPVLPLQTVFSISGLKFSTSPYRFFFFIRPIELHTTKERIEVGKIYPPTNSTTPNRLLKSWPSYTRYRLWY